MQDAVIQADLTDHERCVLAHVYAALRDHIKDELK